MMLHHAILSAAMAAMLAAPVFAQSADAPKPPPPPVGEIVGEIEMIPSRTVRFAPEDGGLRIISVVDNQRFEPVLRHPGEVGMSLIFAQEIGTVLEFNSGLDWTFDYDVKFVTPSGQRISPDHPVCPVGSQRVGAEQWPQPYTHIVISNVRKAEVSGC